MALALSACANSGSGLPPLQSPPPEVNSITLGNAGSAAVAGAVGSATEVYSRVALGAVSCWFGKSGPLKKDYIYHAEADAASRGGKAEIVVHERDPTQPNPRGPKAYRINIDPTGEQSATVRAENMKMSAAFAAGMTGDVGRWARGDQGCAGTSTAVGWAPDAAQPDEPVAVKKVPKKSKPKAAQKKPAPKPAVP